MRLNKFIASATGLSRRAADDAIAHNRVRVNGQLPSAGQQVSEQDTVVLDDTPLAAAQQVRSILLHKPTGYVCSREGQGNRTVYDLLPEELHALKPVGRLDKDSSGLLFMTTDGDLAHKMTHPSFEKIKGYNIVIDKPLQPLHRQMITDYGLRLEDGMSKLQLDRLKEDDDTMWHVIMHEGRNRQIRRTFESLGYTVTKLHRVQFGSYLIDALPIGKYKEVTEPRG